MGGFSTLFIQTSHALSRAPRKVLGALRRIGEQPRAPGAGLVDIAMAGAGGDRHGQWSLPIGGMLRSGDLEIAVDARHLRISRELRTVVLLPFERTRGLEFRAGDGGAVALVALTDLGMLRHVLDAADLSAAEWDVVADLIAEATRWRLLLDLSTLPPPGPSRTAP